MLKLLAKVRKHATILGHAGHARVWGKLSTARCACICRNLYIWGIVPLWHKKMAEDPCSEIDDVSLALRLFSTHQAKHAGGRKLGVVR